MNRAQWIREKRRLCEIRMDTRFAPTYNAEWGYINAGQEMGLPVVEGEWAHQGSYHYYPSLDRVRQWLCEACFAMLEEATGDGYYHVLARTLHARPIILRDSCLGRFLYTNASSKA